MTYRVMQKFWLDLEKPDEEEINQLIDNYKRQRQFSRIIRDGIRLMWSLGQGNLDVLFELFPWVMDVFYQRALADYQPQDAALQQQLARLETLLLQQGNAPIGTGSKKLLTPQATPLEEDDIDDSLLVIRQATSKRESAQNFLNSAFDLVQ